MKQTLREIAVSIGIHYTTLHKLSNTQDDFPEFELKGSKFMYDKDQVSSWYLKYKTKDKRTIANRKSGINERVKIFLNNIFSEDIPNKGICYDYNAICEKLRYKSFTSIHQQKLTPITFQGKLYVTKSVAHMVALLYFEYNGDFVRTRNIPFEVSELIIEAGCKQANTRNPNCTKGINEPVDINITQDELALELLKASLIFKDKV